MEYFEKARELARLLLQTKEGERSSAAKDAFLARPDCVKKLDEFNEAQDNIRQKVHNGEYTEAEFKVVSEETRQKFEELQKEPVIAELFESSSAFNDLITQTINIFSATISGTSEAEGNCSSCGGVCSGCH